MPLRENLPKMVATALLALGLISSVIGYSSAHRAASSQPEPVKIVNGWCLNCAAGSYILPPIPLKP